MDEKTETIRANPKAEATAQRGGQIMPAPDSNKYAVYQLDQGGSEVGWVHVRSLKGGTVEVWQLYKNSVSGAGRAGYIWPSSQDVPGGTSSQKTVQATTFIYRDVIDVAGGVGDTGGVGAANYIQVEASCKVQGS